jgi:hypothetical protein
MTNSESITSLLSRELTDEEINDLWYDWFCKNTSLVNKGRKLINKLKQVVKNNNGKFDPEKTYVFFKNNCPIYGKLYDDFRICDIETGDVIFCIIPRSGFDEDCGQAQAYSASIAEYVAKGTWKDVINYFKS